MINSIKTYSVFNFKNNRNIFTHFIKPKLHFIYVRKWEIADENTYGEEEFMIKVTLEQNGFPETIFQDVYDAFLVKFAINMWYSPFNQYEYHDLREQVLPTFSITNQWYSDKEMSR